MSAPPKYRKKPYGCEAAHTPVIWVTQVLEILAKTGVGSRAEVTDAAMSECAECLILNKGPFIRNAGCP